MSDMPIIDEANSNYVKLPYQLTSGVMAMREGLQFASPLMVTVEYFPYDVTSIDEPLTIPWPDAAERLHYRECEPWCREHHHERHAIVCMQGVDGTKSHYDGAVLHRLAAILCDDGEAFKVLHWCVHNLGGSYE